MNKLPFVLWMLGWPTLFSFGSTATPRKDLSDSAVIVWLIIWVVVGCFAYESEQKKPKKEETEKK